jgi:hypothetical protein
MIADSSSAREILILNAWPHITAEAGTAKSKEQRARAKSKEQPQMNAERRLSPALRRLLRRQAKLPTTTSLDKQNSNGKSNCLWKHPRDTTRRGAGLRAQ